MQTIQYHNTMDKSKWDRGPWDNEPDKIQWQDEATGLPCLIVRNYFGAWCGYVGVSEGHKFYGVHYDGEEIGRTKWKDHDFAKRDYENSPSAAVSVHGGLTFSDSCHTGMPEDKGICHKVEPGENDKVWWFGFDCGHAMDLAPGMVAQMRYLSPKGQELISDPKWVTYRDVAYIQKEVTNLAKQLKEIGNGKSA